MLGMTDMEQLCLAELGASRRPAWKSCNPGAGKAREANGAPVKH